MCVWTYASSRVSVDLCSFHFFKELFRAYIVGKELGFGPIIVEIEHGIGA